VNLTFNGFDPVGRGILRIRRDRQHGSANRSQSTVEVTTVAELGAHALPVDFHRTQRKCINLRESRRQIGNSAQ
jgi:hypothetical protein